MGSVTRGAGYIPLLMGLILPFVTLATEVPKSIVSSKFDLPSSLRIDCQDLEFILDEMRTLIESANGGSAPPWALVAEVTLEAQRASYTTSDWSNLCASQDTPSVTLSFRLHYTNPYAPIAHVTIDFDDFYRQIEVEGSNRAQVDALAILLQRRFEDHTISYSGRGFREVLALIWMLLTVMTMAIMLWRILPNTVLTVDFEKRTFKKTTDRPEPTPALLIGITISPIVIATLLIVLCPWSEWFPGTAIYKESGGFLHRHGDELGLLYFVAGLVVSVALPLAGPWLASLAFGFFQKKRPG
jgi:hypothetical protein